MERSENWKIPGSFPLDLMAKTRFCDAHAIAREALRAVADQGTTLVTIRSTRQNSVQWKPWPIKIVDLPSFTYVKHVAY